MKKFILTFFLLTFSNPAHAVLKIDITQGHVNPMPIAIPDFIPADPSQTSNANGIVQVVKTNLKHSGLFSPIDKRAFIEKITENNVASPRFVDWRQIDAQALVTGIITARPDGKIQIDFRLWDTFSQKQVAGKSFVTENENWRRVAHLISDEIYKRLTGEEGYFDTRIVYVAEIGQGKRPTKRLAIMDQDGANHKFLTSGRDLVLTPRFSPNSQKILYLSYARKKPRVYLRDIETGNEKVLGDFQGMTFAPRFSPNGKYAVFSAALSGNSDIFTMNLNNGKIARITTDSNIDTSPSFSPDGRQIAFNSDRGGKQQLYVMDADGSNVTRISFGEGKYATPVWSPRGDWVAFTKMHRGRFYIGVMRPDGSGERLITESYLDEGPTWSPNGRVIIFTRGTPSYKGRRGTSKLYSIDITGHNLREIITPTNASDPAWSPLLE